MLLLILKEFTRLIKKPSALISPQNKSRKLQEEISVLMRPAIARYPEQKKSKGDSSTVEEEDNISTT